MWWQIAVYREECFDFGFLDGPWFLVRSTILLFLITYTGVPVLIPSSRAFFAARRRARNASFASREGELILWLIDYLKLRPSEINCGALPELSYHTH